MNIREAASYVTPALGTQGEFGMVHFGGGRMWATDAATVISSPVFLGSDRFAVDGKDLKDAMAKFEDPLADFDREANVLRLKSGRASIKLSCLPSTIEEPSFDGDNVEQTAGWMEILQSLASIVDQKVAQPWGRSVMIFPDSAMVVAARMNVMAWCDMTFLGGKQAMIPAEALMNLKARGDVQSVKIHKDWMSLNWDDGVKFRTQLLAGEMPVMVYNKRKDWKEPTVDLSEVWIKSVSRAAALSEGHIDFTATGVFAKTDSTELSDEEGGGVMDSARLSTGVVEVLLKLAKKVGGGGYPLSWSGSSLRGLASGMRV